MPPTLVRKALILSAKKLVDDGIHFLAIGLASYQGHQLTHYFSFISGSLSAGFSDDLSG